MERIVGMKALRRDSETAQVLYRVLRKRGGKGLMVRMAGKLQLYSHFKRLRFFLDPFA